MTVENPFHDPPEILKLLKLLPTILELNLIKRNALITFLLRTFKTFSFLAARFVGSISQLANDVNCQNAFHKGLFFTNLNQRWSLKTFLKHLRHNYITSIERINIQNQILIKF